MRGLRAVSGTALTALVLMGSSAWGAGRRTRPALLRVSPAVRPLSIRPQAGRGRVVYLSSTRAYLDRGRADGLAIGTELALTRQGRSVGSCRVDSVADHSASCTSQRLRPGDSFPAMSSAPIASTRSEARALTPESELSRRRAAIQAAPLPLVEFNSDSAGGSEHRSYSADARLTDSSWFNGGSNFHQDRLDIAIRGAPIGLGLRLYLDATALSWVHRPAETLSPATDTNQFYVREAEVASRDSGQKLTFALGRIWPWYAPGMSSLDGAQIGFRAQDASWELGAFGGGVPDPLSTAPTFQRTAVGAYFAGRLGDTASVLTHEARVSLMTAPEYGARVEGEERVRAWLWRAVDLGADVRFGVGGAQALGALDVARFDADLRLAQFLRVNGGVRYSGNDALDLPIVGAIAQPTRSFHSDASVAFTPIPSLSFSALGTTARDITASLLREMIGAEIGVPSFLADRAGLTVGWMEERGWVSGRNVYAQLTLQPIRQARLLARVTYAQELTYQFPDSPPMQELAVFLSAEYTLFRWLSFRVAASGRTDLTQTLAGNLLQQVNGPTGLVLQASVAARL